MTFHPRGFYIVIKLVGVQNETLLFLQVYAILHTYYCKGAHDDSYCIMLIFHVYSKYFQKSLHLSIFLIIFMSLDWLSLYLETQMVSQ